MSRTFSGCVASVSPSNRVTHGIAGPDPIRKPFSHAKRVNPILNVTNIIETFAWFENLGWKRGFSWGTPPTFGSVNSGDCEISFARVPKAAVARAIALSTFESDDDSRADKGVWMSVWVDDVDAIHRHCQEQGLEITWPPTDEAWGVREFHVRHPDGHVFRISQGRGGDE